MANYTVIAQLISLDFICDNERNGLRQVEIFYR